MKSVLPSEPSALPESAGVAGSPRRRRYPHNDAFLQASSSSAFRTRHKCAAPAPASVEASLSSTRKGFFGAVRGLFQTQRTLDEAFWDELEERLIQADLGAHTTGDLIEGLQAQHARKPFLDPRDAELALRSELLKLLKSTGDTGLFLPAVADGIAIILVIE